MENKERVVKIEWSETFKELGISGRVCHMYLGKDVPIDIDVDKHLEELIDRVLKKGLIPRSEPIEVSDSGYPKGIFFVMEFENGESLWVAEDGTYFYED